MPKVVDHDERRAELAQAALRVISRDGLEAATTRAVALECGWSTGVLKHYYRNKDELLHAALRDLERRNLDRFDAGASAATGLEAIRAAVAAVLAADRGETRVWIAFISRASVDPPTAAAWRRAMRAWTRRWADLVRRGQEDGSISPDLDADATGVELHALMNGLRIRSFFEPGAPTAAAGAGNFLDGLRNLSSART